MSAPTDHNIITAYAAAIAHDEPACVVAAAAKWRDEALAALQRLAESESAEAKAVGEALRAQAKRSQEVDKYARVVLDGMEHPPGGRAEMTLAIRARQKRECGIEYWGLGFKRAVGDPTASPAMLVSGDPLGLGGEKGQHILVFEAPAGWALKDPVFGVLAAEENNE